MSELFEIKNDADRLQELRKARDMAATEARNYGNNARGVERRLQNEESEEEKTLNLNTKKISKNIIKTLLQNHQREQDSKQVGIHIR